MARKDYYQLLGVEKSASAETIKAAYRKLAKQNHPDATNNDPAAEKRFMEIAEAYEVLGKPENRAKYDQLLADEASGRFRATQGGQPFTSYERRQTDVDWDELLSQMFGWQGGSYEQNFRAHESLDVENTITVPLREAYEGTQKSIRIAGEEVLQFSIPAGIQPDERICLRARGRMGKSGRRGDRYLRIAFSADDQMTLEGLDIHMTRDIMPWDAALGATLDILPLTQHLRVKVKPGTRSGVKLRLAGQGYRDKQGRRGDLYLTLVVQNPAHLTPELTTLYQQAAEAAASPPTSRERNGR